MGNPKAFLEIHRQEAGYRPIQDRIHDFSEVEQTLNTKERRAQASRCMDCGVPFCHWACPLGNKPPEWNDALYKGDWELAYRTTTRKDPAYRHPGRKNLLRRRNQAAAGQRTSVPPVAVDEPYSAGEAKERSSCRECRRPSAAKRADVRIWRGRHRRNDRTDGRQRSGADGLDG